MYEVASEQEKKKNYITISTTVPLEMAHDIKKRGWGWNELIAAGYLYRKQRDGWTVRQEEAEQKIEKLANKVAQLSKELWEMELKNRTQ